MDPEKGDKYGDGPPSPGMGADAMGYAKAYHTALKGADRWTVLKTLVLVIIVYYSLRWVFQSENSIYLWPGMIISIIVAFPYMRKLITVDKIMIWEIPADFFQLIDGVWRKNKQAGIIGVYKFPLKKYNREGWEPEGCLNFYTNKNKLNQIRLVSSIDWINKKMIGTKRSGLSPIDFEMNELLICDLIDTLEMIMKKNIVHGEKVEILSLQRLGQQLHFLDDILSMRTVTGLKKISSNKKLYGIEKTLGDLRGDPEEVEEGDESNG